MHRKGSPAQGEPYAPPLDSCAPTRLGQGTAISFLIILPFPLDFFRAAV